MTRDSSGLSKRLLRMKENRKTSSCFWCCEELLEASAGANDVSLLRDLIELPNQLTSRCDLFVVAVPDPLPALID